jgi:vacuolar-type H+-ATPase subunit H
MLRLRNTFWAAKRLYSQKIDDTGSKVKDILERESLELILIAQNFKDERYKTEDLRKLEAKISYLVDLVDYARISNQISEMNAKVFVDSQINFLKHIINLNDQRSSLALPLYRLEELDQVVARHTAKEIAQNNFSDIPSTEKSLRTSVPKTFTPQVKPSEAAKPEPKKIVEEVMIAPQKENETSPESIEHEIEKRRQNILNTLTSGGGSINEISSKMKGVSAKTVQRDLLELMRDKKVIMLGKKRWAKYYLK